MFDLEVTWATPLEVKLQFSLHRKFRSVNDAADFMETEWPTHHGNHYERALMYVLRCAGKFPRRWHEKHFFRRALRRA